MSTSLTADRRRFLECFAGLGLSSTLFPGVLWAQLQQKQPPAITREILRDASAVAGITFSEHELDAMLDAVNLNVARFAELRRESIGNDVAPPLHFNPLAPDVKIDRTRRPTRASAQPGVSRPRNLEEVAFWTIPQLASLIRTRQVKSAELTEMYVDRLKRHNPKLNCVVTLTEERARKQSREADLEIAAGRYRGPLHGIPWGVKDLCAVKGYPTTWGAAPFKNRMIEEDATVVSRLDAAGAVLVAKLSTGELAVDDVWFGGQTMNPWDLSMGSQGSSAGPGAATAAGLVGFSIGTETLGSILAPSGICGVTGLRPTFGRVSRHGVMTLSWTLDKIGPMCRAVEDCAIVLLAIQGPDGQDLSVHDIPFNWDAGLNIRKLRVGYLKAAFSNTRQTAQTDANDAAALEQLRTLGVSPVPIELPEHAWLSPRMIQWPEMNAALRDPFQTRPGEVLRQDRVVNLNAARFITAADYLEANRIRGLLMREMARTLAEIDVYVVPFDYADYTPNPVAAIHTSVANMTGQPSVIVPHGFNEKGNPTSLTFAAGVFGEAGMLALARAYQNATDWHRRHPKLFV